MPGATPVATGDATQSVFAMRRGRVDRVVRRQRSRPGSLLRRL